MAFHREYVSAGNRRPRARITAPDLQNERASWFHSRPGGLQSIQMRNKGGRRRDVHGQKDAQTSVSCLTPIKCQEYL